MGVNSWHRDFSNSRKRKQNSIKIKVSEDRIRLHFGRKEKKGDHSRELCYSGVHSTFPAVKRLRCGRGGGNSKFFHTRFTHLGPSLILQEARTKIRNISMPKGGGRDYILSNFDRKFGWESGSSRF